MQVAYGLPLDFHDDGTPIFNRGDFIRDPIPLTGDNNPVIYENLILPEHRHLFPNIKFNLIVLPPATDKPTSAYLNEKNAFGRIIQALDPNCSAAIQLRDAKTIVKRFYLYHINPMRLVLPPPNFETQLLNNSTERPARYFEIQEKDEKRIFKELLELDGFGYKMKMDATLDPNPNYDELPIPEIRQGLEQFRFINTRPLYTMMVEYASSLQSLQSPQFFSGAI